MKKPIKLIETAVRFGEEFLSADYDIPQDAIDEVKRELEEFKQAIKILKEHEQVLEFSNQ